MTVALRSPARGFTLVEVIIVIALVAVMAAVLSPMLMTSPIRALQAEARDVATTLRETRRLALARQSRQRFVIDTDNGRYGIASNTLSAALPDGMQAQLTTDESLLTNESTGSIDFFPDGSSSGGRVSLVMADRFLDVDVEWLTGRIRVREPH